MMKVTHKTKSATGKDSMRCIPCIDAKVAGDLGMDAASGKRRSTIVAKARVAKTAKRLEKLKVIKKFDKRALKLFKTNLWPAMSFGISAMGVARTSIAKMRRQAGQAALGRSGQCSTTAIAIAFNEGTDPAVKIRQELARNWFMI